MQISWEEIMKMRSVPLLIMNNSTNFSSQTPWNSNLIVIYLKCNQNILRNMSYIYTKELQPSIFSFIYFTINSYIFKIFVVLFVASLLRQNKFFLFHIKLQLQKWHLIMFENCDVLNSSYIYPLTYFNCQIQLKDTFVVVMYLTCSEMYMYTIIQEKGIFQLRIMQ